MSPFNPPPTPEQLAQAADLFADGASQREVQRTTGISRETLRQRFPQNGWSYKEGGDFRALINTLETTIRRVNA